MSGRVFRKKGSSMRLSRHLSPVVTCAMVLFAPVRSLFAFGKNKVQYKELSWSYLDAPHFHVHYHQNGAEIAGIAACWVEANYAALSNRFSFVHKEKLPLIVYNDPNLFQQTNVILELLPEGVGGFTELFKNRIVLPFNGSYDDLRHVLHHELVHAFMFGILYEQAGSSFLRTMGFQVPLWFAEGLAEYLSSGWNIESDMFLMDRTVFGTVPVPGPELSSDYLAYKGGQSFLHFLATTRGERAFNLLLKGFKETKNVETAIKDTYGEEVDRLGEEWVRELKRLYWPEIGRREDPARTARSVTLQEKTKNHYNLRPRISPDGTKIAFFSDRKDYTRIIITDRKGSTLAEVSQSGYGGFFESFHPFRSGMTWNPDGNRLAFVTQQSGVDVIRIVDIVRKRLVRTIDPRLSSIDSPDWSADGKRIVFCGIRGAWADLYIYDFGSDSVRRITSDIRSESGPRFSPDGKTIVFAAQDTCENPGGTGPTKNLYRFDLSAGTVSQLTDSPHNEKDPCFSGDGSRIAFVSDRNGIDNIYVMPVDSPGGARPLTDIIGGCSHPDWARKDSALVFGLFQKQSWDVWVMESPIKHLKDSSLVLTRWAEKTRDSAAPYFLAPIVHGEIGTGKKRGKIRPDTISVRNRADSLKTTTPAMSSVSTDTSASDSTNTAALSVSPDSTGALASDSIRTVDTVLTASTNNDSLDTALFVDGPDSAGTRPGCNGLASRPYRLRFSPDMVAVGLGISSIYGYAGQGYLVLSDIMGNHQITLAGDIQGNFQDYAHIFTSYLCLKYRVDFGGGGFFTKDYVFPSIYGDSLYHDTNAGLLFLVRYPFSTFSRLDLNMYYSHVDRVPYRQTADWRIVKDLEREKHSFSIAVPSFSFVFDNVLWGLTGPVNGIRAEANLVASPPLDLVEAHFVSADIDFRKYFHFGRRFVWANKVALGGTISLDRERPARRFFLGGNENWIFFDPSDVNREKYEKEMTNSFYSEYVVPFRGWNYFDLTGTRFAVYNTEFRFPFVREVSVVWPLPIRIQYVNGAVFTDIGNAWDRVDQYEGIPLPRNIYGGIGFGMRANLGIFVLRYDRAWQTDWTTYLAHPKTYFSLGAEF